MSTLQNPEFQIHASDWLQAKSLRDKTYYQRKSAIAAHKRKLARYEEIKKAVEREIAGFENQLNRIEWKRGHYDQEMQSIKLRLAECLGVNS